MLAYEIVGDGMGLGDGGSILFGLLMSVGVGQLLARLDARKQCEVVVELGDNKNYIAVMTPEVLRRELDICKLRCGRLVLGI